VKPLATSPAAALQAGASTGGMLKRAGLLVAVAALIAAMRMPAPQGLPVAGQVVLAHLIVLNLGLQQASAFVILMLLSLFLIVIHLGFASATALASTMIPIIISVLLAVQTPEINAVGMTMLLQFVVSFGFILPVNAPQNMIVYGTDTFDARDFIRTGLVITLAAAVLLLVFSLTYWPWMGYMTKAD
jgi:di/tricarboxylate transporter